ncbi:lipase family alpha/beta hydrolase [Planococcus beijingensis]|uniref:lipase family alpha/beta hydrolase n=1 Tax=Planococcus beijingensis TaxID=2782551 RepID=UPI00193B0143|nr:hypothetical protein [Planococcus beijingensis]
MKNILFIPGVMGSHLYEGRSFFGRQINRWYSMNSNSVLRLKLSLDFRNDGSDKIIPGPPIENGISIIGGWVGKNVIYSPIIKSLQSLPSSEYKVHLIGYDWRKDIINDTCSYLHDTISQIQTTPDEEVIIVAHSMGGLLTKAYTKWAKDRNLDSNIAKVITLGTPWKGSPDSFNVLLNGVEDKGRFFPSVDITRKISRTFPSAFQLLPSETYFNGLTYINDKGKNLSHKESFNKLYEIIEDSYTDGEQVNQELEKYINVEWENDVEHHNFIGIKHGTLGTIPLDNSNKEEFKALDGDETVPLYSALPSFSKKSKLYYVHASHMGMIKHIPLLEKVNSIIQNTHYKNKEILETYQQKEDWTFTKVDCPVDVFYDGEIEDVNNVKSHVTKIKLGDTKYLIHNSESNTVIEVDPYDDGITQIETIVQENSEIINRFKFKTIEADPARKAIVEVDFKNEKPISTVKLATENINAREVTGMEVPLNVTILEIPRTSSRIVEREKKVNSNFDYNGAILFLENIGEYVLDTFYRINSSEWKIYNGEINLIPEKNIDYGKSKIEFYSEDIFGNKEATRSRSINIYPEEPKFIYNVHLEPDSLMEIEILSQYEGLNEYNFEYKVNNKEVELMDSLDPTKKNSVEIIITDIFGNKSFIEKEINLGNLIESLWSADGYNETFEALTERIDGIGNRTPEFLIGKSKKELSDKIPVTAKYLVVKYGSFILNIKLINKLEVYFHYHSEVIQRKEKTVKMSFSVYDSKGEVIKELEPIVIYSLLPILDEVQDIKRPAVKKEKGGIYTFSIDTRYLTKAVTKLKIEIKDNKKSKRNIYSKSLILE